MSLTTFLLGRRLANREVKGRKIGVFEGVPAMGLDGLGARGMPELGRASGLTRQRSSHL
jgi:hypothetical protein